MPDDYSRLQASILDWLGRPNDPLVQPAVPDFIALFEEEARGRLRTPYNEVIGISLPPAVPPDGTFVLPLDYAQMRRVVYDGEAVEYLAPWDLAGRSQENTVKGKPNWYTIEGTKLRLAVVPDTANPVLIDYYSLLPPLTIDAPSNWLSTRYPSLYLFGSLVAAEAYIGDDERVGNWVNLREAGFTRVQREAVAARLGGAPLQMRVDGPTP